MYEELWGVKCSVHYFFRINSSLPIQVCGRVLKSGKGLMKHIKNSIKTAQRMTLPINFQPQTSGWSDFETICPADMAEAIHTSAARQYSAEVSKYLKFTNWIVFAQHHARQTIPKLLLSGKSLNHLEKGYDHKPLKKLR